MNLRCLVASVPVIALLFAACADQENPAGPTTSSGGTEPTQPGGEPDGGTPDADTPDPPVNESNKQLCVVTKPGDYGKVFTGTLLLPESVVEGELFIDKTGAIVCADKNCSSAAGYASATRIECKDAVISPGLINPHDHISYANNPPHKPTDERFEHRHDWRKGARQHSKITTGADKVTNAVEAAELR
ncbi:MAG TPA: hypothetical protein VM580_29785, partial [Labilithrix sp.]|nr:hypothetical protein [Labilithrix sp.]